MEEIVNAPSTVPVIVEPKPALIAGARPRALVPTDLDQAWRIAQMVHKSGTAPKDMNTAEKLIVAIMHGLEIGIPPMMALQRIAVINGRPALWGDAVPAVALATGLVEDFHEFITGDDDNMVATCRVRRKGIKSAAERTFSVADAKKAGLWGKSGPWQQYPKRMLQMRARVAFRDLFADALGGLYIAEEIQDVEPLKDVTPRPEVRSSREKAELPPEVRPHPTAAPETQQEVPATETAEPKGRPLPPPARTRAPQQPKDDGEIPLTLQRNCPLADQPEDFREWIVIQLGNAKTAEAIQKIWDDHIQPNIDNDQILPPDMEDLNVIFDSRKQQVGQ